MVIQAGLIMAANLRLVPLTGVTLPFVSYGGSSVITNGLVVGLLLALSDRRALWGAGAGIARDPLHAGREGAMGVEGAGCGGGGMTSRG
ncbi:MAG: FtsW/RodA/SpoVE family cell cycle protein [Chloroflexota bacterium]